ncbi:MAG: hypothetical protein K9I92_06685 [Chitinophagaceae bacterium]|nr:hypothetical protein [Chitinophagaceae bacterium]
MGLPTIILQAGTDRRVFDLYNQLSGHYPTIIWSSTAMLGEAFLYPKAIRLRLNGMKELLDYVERRKDQHFVWLPLIEEEAVWLLEQIAIPSNFFFQLPDLKDYNTARDKRSFTLRFMQDRLTPRLYSPDELHDHFPNDGVVVKPAIGKGAIGRRFIHTASELNNVHSGDLIQERIGEGKEVIGAFFLCKNGEVLAHYQHRRIRTFPEEGGVSCCAETTMIEEVKVAGSRIMKALNWSGLAMIEFLKHPQENIYLAIECNARLWGTVLLSEFSGHHLVLKYIDLCMQMPIRETDPMPNASIRWYFPYEIWYALRSPFRHLGLLYWGGKHTCYIGGTGAGWMRSLGFVFFSVLNPEKWQILYNKITTSIGR